MTVKELIEKLEQYPDKFEVVVLDEYNQEYIAIVGITHCAETNKVIITHD